MNPQELFERLEQCLSALSKGNIQLKQLALKKDNTERDYKIALRKEMLKLQLEGYKATLINDLARGEETVAKLRLERDIAKDSYFVCLNAIENIRLEIECIRSRITWERVELKNS